MQNPTLLKLRMNREFPDEIYRIGGDIYSSASQAQNINPCHVLLGGVLKISFLDKNSCQEV